jgi:cytochrome c556
MTGIQRMGAVVLTIFMAVSGWAFAHSGATGIVKERMDAMSDIGKAMKTIGLMVKGNNAFDSAKAHDAASAISRNATRIPELFPHGSAGKPSEATLEIWENWDEFAAMAEQMKADSDALASVAENAADAATIRAQFANVGKSCGSCHRKFRAKK